MKKIVLVVGIMLAAITNAATSVDLAFDALRGYEGFSSTVYVLNGIEHIGYGFTNPKLTKKKFMTRNEADTELRRILASDLIFLRSKVKGLTPGQEACCLSFIYNVGRTNFAKSTFLKKLKVGDTVAASNELMKWIYASGKVSNGLVNRRRAERTLFLS